MTWAFFFILIRCIMGASWAGNLRPSIDAGNETCFKYRPYLQLITLECTTLHWQDSGFDNNDYIQLNAGEVFDGREHTINLDGISGIKGLFKTQAPSFELAPVVKMLHMIGGRLAGQESYFFPKNTVYGMIDLCSASGPVNSWRGGGFCGDLCGRSGGHVVINRSYILGIIGQGGTNHPGGITGSRPEMVTIHNCYSRGDIQGGNGAGGLAGEKVRKVDIAYSYSSGSVSSSSAGGLIGGVRTSGTSNWAKISYSVYNNNKIEGKDGTSRIEQEGNSNAIEDIEGALFEGWDPLIWLVPGVNALPELRREIPATIPAAPAATASQTTTATATSSCTGTQTRTPTITNTRTATSSYTRSSTLSPTPSTTKTSTSTQSPTPSTTESSTPTSSQTQTGTTTTTAVATSSYTGTQTRTQTITNTRTATPSYTRSSTLSPTSSITKTSTSTQSPTPTTTADMTTTATASRSDSLPNNGSRLIASACGRLHEFDCVSIEYQTAMRINGSMPTNPFRNTSQITAQSVDGSLPTILFLCGLDIEGTMANPVDCSNKAKDYSVPFYAEYEVISNQSCIARIRTHDCRLFSFVVSIFIKVNASTAQSGRTLAENQMSTTYSMTISVVSDKEILLATRQSIHFPYQADTTNPIDVSSHPSKFTKTILRDQETVNTHNISIQVVGRSDVWVSWKIPPSLHQFIESPESNTISPRLFPVRLAVRYQILSIRMRLLPHGVSAGSIQIVFSVKGNIVATRLFDVNVTVLEGDIRLRQPLVKIARSSLEGPASRQIFLSNEGDKAVKWKTRGFVLQNNAWVEGGVRWLQFPSEGNLFAVDESSFAVEMFPQLVSGLGVFQAWILIQTDAWTGDSQNIDEEFGELSLPLVETVGISFWVHVRFIVSSIFVCQQFAPVTTLMPHETQVLPLRVINMESSPVTIRLTNVSIVATGNTSTCALNQSALAHNQTINVERRAVNKVIQLTPWWTIAPSTLALYPGISGGFRVKIAYSDSDLRPAEYKFMFILEIIFGGVGNSPAGVINNELRVSFSPGVASPLTSFLVGNKTTGSIGESLSFAVKLLDAFEHGPAKALFDSTGSPLIQQQKLPLLTITTRTISSSTTNVVRLNVHSSRGALTMFQFALDLQSSGKVEVDVKLSNYSISGFPIRISSQPVQCHLDFEVPDSTGTKCLCTPGHHRMETGKCSLCVPGTFMSVASNSRTCRVCSRGTFSEEGQPACDSCIERGIQCTSGVITMKDGYWCELCQQLKFPRHSILEEIRHVKVELFHKCNPEESCLVNATSFSSECAIGYNKQGPVCDKCSNGFVKTETGECLPCESGSRDLVFTVAGGLVVVLVMTAITILSYREVISDVPTGNNPGLATDCDSINANTGRRNKPTHDGITKQMANPLYSPPKSTPSSREAIQKQALQKNIVSVRHIALLLMDYFQIAFILHAMEISPFASNSEWVNTVSTLAILNPSKAGAVQCTTNSSPFQASMATIVSPAAMMLCLMVIQTLTNLCLSKCANTFRWNTWISSFARSAVLLMNLIHMSVSHATLEVFDIYPIKIASKERWNLDLTLETSSPRYKVLHITAIVSLLIVVIGYPLLTIVYYIKLYSKADTPEALESVSKMTGGFRVHDFGFLWESIVIIRKVILLLVVSFVTGPIAQLLWASVTLIGSVFVLAVLMPYKKPFINALQYVMILVAFGSLAIGFLMNVSDEEGGGLTRVDTLSNVVLILQSSLFVTSLVAGASLAPKAVKGLYLRLLAMLPQCVQRSQQHKKKNDEWTFTHSALTFDYGIVLPSRPRLSLQSPNVVSFSNLMLQKDDATEKVISNTQRSRKSIRARRSSWTSGKRSMV